MVKEFDITGLVNLEHLCLEKVKLGSSPFISNPNLRTLNLITCILPPCISWLTSTPTALANLKCLEITHCWWVKKLKFKGLEQLNYLFLTQNRLEHISSTYFLNLGELVVLDLSYNKIRGFGDTPFVNLTKLKSLNLDWNAIPFLKESWFEGLNNLEELSLRNNCIEEFPVGIFSSLKTLKQLQLNSNPAQQFTDSFIGLENLETLSLSQMGKGKFNRVEVATLNGLRKLNELLLCDNNIEFIESGSFRVMSNLTLLNLNGNRLVIEECRRILSNDLSGLKTLSLGSNRLGEMGDSLFVNLGKLEHLSLICNDLDHLGADCFDGLSNLRELNLAGNDFVEFDVKCLENLSKLRVVNLEENPITDYEQLEENLSALGIRVYHGI
jgi:Leucine-rich repeat (LRR) protein